MDEQYYKLFSLPENLYAPGAPLMISQGGLYRNEQTGQALARLTFQNIGTQTIRAAKVHLTPLDCNREILDRGVTHRYTGLNAWRDDSFGADVYIPLHFEARAFSVTVTEVVFADKSQWGSEGTSWESVPSPKPLSMCFQDDELVKQYRIQFGADADYMPIKQGGAWCCACGKWNREEEPLCHHCNKSIAALLDLDTEKLAKLRDIRVAVEQQKQEAAEARMQKLQKFVKCAFPYALAAVIVAIGLSHVVKSVKAEAARASAYKAAASLVEMGEYDAAIEAFTSLGDYKDAQEQIILTQERKYEAINQPIYDNAMLALERGKHQEAYDLFLSLGDYKDAAQILTKFQKRKTRLHHDIYTTGSYSSKWSYEYYTNYTYNRLGSLIKEETVVPKRPDAVKPSVKEYIYDENHRLVQTKVTTYSDSEMQNLVSVITYDLDPNGRTLNRTAITYENGVATETVTNNINTLSPDGCLEKQTVVEQYEEYELTSDYTYDSKGNILTHKRTLRYFDKKKKAETQEYVYTYDLDGNKLTALEKRNGNVYDYEYDAEGNICKGTITYANGKTENPIKYTDSYIYDGKENLKEWTRNYYSYGTKEYTSYTYDADNDLTGYVFYHGSKRSHEAKYTYEMVYTPDAMK